MCEDCGKESINNIIIELSSISYSIELCQDCYTDFKNIGDCTDEELRF